MATLNLGRVAPKPRGVYNSGTLYDVLDIVTCDGASYLCRQLTIGNDPPYHTHNKYWFCMAYGSGEKGDTGMSAYELAVLNGYRGSEVKWLLSLVGPQGDSGYQGDFSDFLVVNSYDANYSNSVLQKAALSAYLGKYLYDRHVDKTASEYQALLDAGATVDTTFYYIYEEDESVTTYTLTVLSNNTAYGTVSGGGVYETGKTAIILATAREDCEFVMWSDGDTNIRRTITITSNLTLTATFRATSSEEETASFEFSDNLANISTATFSGSLVTIPGVTFSGNTMILTGGSSSEEDEDTSTIEFSNNLVTITGMTFSGNLATVPGGSFSNNLLTNGLN